MARASARGSARRSHGVMLALGMAAIAAVSLATRAPAQRVVSPSTAEKSTENFANDFSNAQTETELVAELHACMKPIVDAPEYAPIKAHISNIMDSTAQQLSDQTFASDEEIQALLVAHPKNNACRQAFLTQLSQTAPSLAALYAAAAADSEHHLSALIDKKERWGDYVTSLKQGAASLDSARIQRIVSHAPKCSDRTFVEEINLTIKKGHIALRLKPALTEDMQMYVFELFKDETGEDETVLTCIGNDDTVEAPRPKENQLSTSDAPKCDDDAFLTKYLLAMQNGNVNLIIQGKDQRAFTLEINKDFGQDKTILTCIGSEDTGDALQR